MISSVMRKRAKYLDVTEFYKIVYGNPLSDLFTREFSLSLELI